MLTPNGPICIGLALLFDKSNIALGTLVGRAGGAAGSNTFFVDRISTGYRLGREAVGSFASAQAVIKFIFDIDGADHGAIPTPGALGFIYIARFAADVDLIVANITSYRFDLTISQ